MRSGKDIATYIETKSPEDKKQFSDELGKFINSNTKWLGYLCSVVEQKNEAGQRLAEVFTLATKELVNEVDFKALYDKVDELLAGISSEFKPSRPSWDLYFKLLLMR
jgi:hypothetical protein